MAAGSAEPVRRRVVVHGRVQGVAFRDATARRARSLGVSGYVRNRSDGTVEAVFEGAPEDVEALVRYCRSGPRLAEVERLVVDPQPVEGLSGFAVG